LFIDGGEPALANHREHDVAGLKPLVDGVDEVVAGLKRVDVDEDILSPELPGKTVVETAGVAGRIVSPVTDENSRHEENECRCILFVPVPQFKPKREADGESAI
jgi:hypothetical protein